MSYNAGKKWHAAMDTNADQLKKAPEYGCSDDVREAIGVVRAGSTKSAPVFSSGTLAAEGAYGPGSSVQSLPC